MVRVTEMDGAYIVEVRVQTEQEKNIMSELLDLDRQTKSQETSEQTKTNDLDSEFDMSVFAPEEIEEAPIQTEEIKPQEDDGLDWLDEATAEEDKDDLIEEELPEQFLE